MFEAFENVSGTCYVFSNCDPRVKYSGKAVGEYNRPSRLCSTLRDREAFFSNQSRDVPPRDHECVDIPVIFFSRG